MISIKTELNLKQFDFNVDYYDIESVTDIEYFIILLTNKANEEDKTLEDILIEFTKEENDLKLLLERKFEKIFECKISDYKNVYERSKTMEEETKKLIPAKERFLVSFESNLNKFLYENEFVSEDFVIESLKNKIERTKTKIYSNITVSYSGKDLKQNFDTSVSDELLEFNILNIKKNSNEKILEKIIKKLKQDTEKYLDFDFDSIKNEVLLKSDFKQISRHYGRESSLATIMPLNTYEKNKIIEFDFNLEGIFVITEFTKYKDIVFGKEEFVKIDDLREYAGYKSILKYVEKNKNEVQSKFLEFLLTNLERKEELELVKKLNIYGLNKNISFSKIDEMIKHKVNIINDEIVAKTDLINFHIKNDPKLVYVYLEMFFRETKFSEIGEKLKVSLLSSVFDLDSSILSKEDYEFISKIVSNKKFIEETINELLKDISSYRSALKKNEEMISSKIKNLDKEQINEIKNLNEQLELLNNFKKITNFIVHIRDKDGEKYKADIAAAKKFDSNLINLKRKLNDIDEIGYSSEEISRPLVDSLKELDIQISNLLKDKNNGRN